jgi:Uma2 family endonuclease
MNVTTKFPVTAYERVELGDELVRFPASWEEYLDLLEEAEYPIEYENQHILAMSIASDPHEVIVSNIITRLNIALDDVPDMATRGSNRHIFIEEFEADYAPDAHVVKGAPAIKILRPGLTANTNPWLIVEVLSPSTRDHDWGTKLSRYKKIPSLRHIIYIEQERPFVSVFNRIGESKVWENTDYDQLDQSFTIAGNPVLLKDVYKKVLFS